MPPELKKRLADALAKLGEDRRSKPDPRDDAVASYKAFMQMPQPEWLGLVASLAGGGVLRVEERRGFEHACRDRPRGGERFSDLLRSFEVLTREHQMERLPDYKRELGRDLDALRVRLLETYHRARLGDGR